MENNMDQFMMATYCKPTYVEKIGFLVWTWMPNTFYNYICDQ